MMKTQGLRLKSPLLMGPINGIDGQVVMQRTNISLRSGLR